MAGPQKPPIEQPKKVEELKSGEEHVAWGCVYLVVGGLILGGILYVFRDYFFNQADFTKTAIMLASCYFIVNFLLGQIEKNKHKNKQ